MPKTFKEQLQAYIQLSHRRAVYSALAEHLRRYTANDLGLPLEVIPVQDGVYSSVQEGTLQEVLLELEAVVNKLNLQLFEFEEPKISAEKSEKKAVAKAHAVK